MDRMLFSRGVFLAAGIYGVLVLAPGFFLEGQLGALGGPFIGGLIDGLWMLLFLLAWRRTPPPAVDP